MSEQSESETDQDAVECQHPHCQKALLDGGHTYTGKHGNGLALCQTHYYDLVAGEKTRAKTPDLGLGTRSVGGFEPDRITKLRPERGGDQ